MFGISDWLRYYEDLPNVGILNTRQVEGVCKKAMGGRFLFAKILLEFSPSDLLIFEDSLLGEAKEECVNEDWLSAIYLGVLDVMIVHPTTPITKFKCNLLDVESHPVDSSWKAFRLAGRFATEEFLRNERII